MAFNKNFTQIGTIARLNVRKTWYGKYLLVVRRHITTRDTMSGVVIKEDLTPWKDAEGQDFLELFNVMAVDTSGGSDGYSC